jgi:hypothetical protein
MENNKIAELEERIKILEEKLKLINFTEAKEITMINCAIGGINTGHYCDFNFQNSSVGCIESDNDDDEEEILDEPES